MLVLSNLLVFIATLGSVYAQSSTGTSIIPLASKRIPYNEIVRDIQTALKSQSYEVSSHTKWIQPTEFVGRSRVITYATLPRRVRVRCVKHPILMPLMVRASSSMLHHTTHLTFPDFCLWAPPTGPSAIGDTEGEEVAWCTKPGRGTRIIPAGALQGVQFMRTPDYVQVVGFVDQSKINIGSDDSGGELDPHGAVRAVYSFSVFFLTVFVQDLRGNPLGGLVYSTAWGNDNTTFEQVIEWTKYVSLSLDLNRSNHRHSFMGGNIFCFKVCNPAGPNAAEFCQHIYDRIGCAYNAPNAAPNNTFLGCDGDNQDYAGVYTDAGGAVQTYKQPAESLGPITSIPYQPRVPASSNCVTYTSADLFAPTGTSSGISESPSSTGSSNPSQTSSGNTGTAGRVTTPKLYVLGASFVIAYLA